MPEVAPDTTDILTTLERTLLLCAKDVLSTEEAAAWCGMGKTAFGNWYRKHNIPAYKHNSKTLFFRKADLDDWMLSGEPTASADAKRRAEEVLERIQIKKPKKSTHTRRPR